MLDEILKRGSISALCFGVIFVAAAGCSDEVSVEETTGEFDVDESSAPRLEVTPPALEFEPHHTERAVLIENVGPEGSELHLEEMELADDGDGAFARQDGWPEDGELVLPAGRTHRLSVVTDSDHTSDDRGLVTMETNDPAIGSAQIELHSPGDPGLQLRADPDPVEFDSTPVGMDDEQTVSFENVGDRRVDVIDIRIEDGQEAFEVASGSPEADDDEVIYRVEPGELIGATVGFRPHHGGLHTGSLVVEVVEPVVDEHRVELRGQGDAENCPVAEASVVERSNEHDGDDSLIVEVDSVVELSATDSYDPEGGELSYEWSLIDYPEGAADQLEDPGARVTELAVHSIGTYEAELAVYNEEGLRSCNTATVEIDAVTTETIRIELNWEESRDLDLHYLHSAGEWGQAPYGVYYNNRDPQWNDGSEVWLNLDSLTGEETEVLVHDNPDTRYHYSAGVHYFGDPENTGAVEAHLKIYGNSALMFDERRLLEEDGGGLDRGDFWYAADIFYEDPEVALEPVDELYENEGVPSE